MARSDASRRLRAVARSGASRRLPAVARSGATCVVVAALLAGCGADGPAASTASARTAPRPPVLCGDLKVSIAGTVAAPAATELSGLVLSRTQRGVLWTHNDSGDSPRVLAVARDGRLLADVAITGAQAFDWEDIAASRDALFIGDIGDNIAQRQSVVVYRVAEPRVTGGRAPAASAPAGRIELRYPDGARDAEALLRDPSSGALVIVSKSSSGRAGVYVARTPAAGTTSTLRRTGTIALGDGEEVTAGDVSADGRTIVVRTYTDAFVWTRRRGESVAAALRRRPCRAGAHLLAEGQGEALALTADGRAFFTVPEGTSPPIRRYAPR